MTNDEDIGTQESSHTVSGSIDCYSLLESNLGTGWKCVHPIIQWFHSWVYTLARPLRQDIRKQVQEGSLQHVSSETNRQTENKPNWNAEINRGIFSHNVIPQRYENKLITITTIHESPKHNVEWKRQVPEGTLYTILHLYRPLKYYIVCNCN